VEGDEGHVTLVIEVRRARVDVQSAGALLEHFSDAPSLETRFQNQST
jgi:hypothetical protein